MTDGPYTLKLKFAEGDVRETKITGQQLETLKASQVLVYFPHDERVSVDSDGTITQHESAIPPEDDDEPEAA